MSDIRSVTYENAKAVSPSDTVNDPAGPFAGLQCTGTAGLATVWTRTGSVQVYLLLGEVLPLLVYRVGVTNTSATGIVGVKSQPYVGPTG
jgi:hypothetical protein